MGVIFKERVRKLKKSSEEYIEEIENLVDALKENKLKELLFDNTNLEIISHKPDRTKCDGFENNATRGKDAEKRICKCLLYKNKDNVIKNCEKCILNKYYNLKKDKYSIADYEVPSYYKGSGIGEIDLIIKDDVNEYATEIKPHMKTEKKDNEETLLRMIAEILTYTYGFEDGKYKKAIAFFENTSQYNEYQEQNSKINELLEIADISVFVFEETKENNVEYKITKLR